MFDGEGGEEPVAEATVAATLGSIGAFTNEIIFQNGRSKMLIERFEVVGMVTVGGAEFDMVDCYAESAVENVHFSNPSGPRPTGSTPANDAPDGALSLDARGTANAQTKAAADAPELACSFSFSEDGEEPEEFPAPIGKTLCYTFEGTGGPVTVDSAGTNFDTMMRIYDSELNQIGCVGDVGDESGFSLQAAATIDTEDGHTYFVQIGGFGFFEEPEFESMAEFARIRINMS